MEKLKRTMRVAADGKTQFSDLPSCLVMDIISRLPLTSLLACRCVCKDWIRLFQDPYFIKLQLAASPVHILDQNIGKEDGIVKFGEFMKEDKGNRYLEVKILNLPTKVDSRTLLNLRPSNYVCPWKHSSKYCRLINSCNGLLCLGNADCIDSPMPLPRSVCVCNPILVEEGYGFEIYTLGGTRQWRSIHDTLGCIPWRSIQDSWRSIQDANTLLHGSLHWINEKQDFICCFDVDGEKFRRLSLPSRGQGKSSAFPQLRVINGCLCALYNCIEIWSMKEYGVEKSWEKVHTFDESFGVSLVSLLFSLNEEEEFEEFLIYDWSKGLISYNLKTKRRRQQRLPRESYCFHFGVAYKPSFISLQDVAKGEEVMSSR